MNIKSTGAESPCVCAYHFYNSCACISVTCSHLSVKPFSDGSNIYLLYHISIVNSSTVEELLYNFVKGFWANRAQNKRRSKTVLVL